MIQFRKAKTSDADMLAQVSERAFHSDINCGADEMGGPPGYNSAKWQANIMRRGDYYAILAGPQLLGVLLFFAREHDSMSWVGCLWTQPGKIRGLAHKPSIFFGKRILWRNDGHWERLLGTAVPVTSTKKRDLLRLVKMGMVGFCLSGELRQYHRAFNCRRET